MAQSSLVEWKVNKISIFLFHIILYLSLYLLTIPSNVHPFPLSSPSPVSSHSNNLCMCCFATVVHVIFSWLECWCDLLHLNLRKCIAFWVYLLRGKCLLSLNLPNWCSIFYFLRRRWRFIIYCYSQFCNLTIHGFLLFVTVYLLIVEHGVNLKCLEWFHVSWIFPSWFRSLYALHLSGQIWEPGENGCWWWIAVSASLPTPLHKTQALADDTAVVP